MFVFLLFIFFLLSINFFFHKKGSISLAFLFTGILFGIATALVTEISSFFHAYNTSSAIFFWSILCCILVFLTLKQKLFDWNKYKFLYATNKKIIWLVGSISILLFIQGILYPPNNWDSMTYHMARIAHWVMNESIEPYPTHIYRQIYQPPLAEWMIGQICLLNRADYFANSLQLFFLLASLGVVNLLMILFKIEKKSRNIACVLVITTPSIFMQAIATQNDIIVGFFILCILYFLILFFKCKTIINALLLGLSIGCALLTKGTAFVYLIPIMGLGIIILIRSLYQKQFVFLKHAPLLLLVIALSLTIPFSHYYRNHKLSNDIFGASEDNYFNENISTKSTLIGIMKNIGIHMSTPVTSNITNQIIEKAHLITKIPISDKKYSYNGIQFKMNNWNHNEDEVSNFFQVILFAFVLLYWIVNRKKQSPTFTYTILFCLFTFFLFTFILKWQPWHMRLQIPLFMLMAIPTAMIISRLNKEKIRNSILGILTVYCLVLAIDNPNRPLLKNEKQAKLKTRFEKYFVAMPPYLEEYKQWRNCAINNIPTQWDVHGDTWEYPIYYDCFYTKRTPFNVINVKNVTENLSSHK